MTKDHLLNPVHKLHQTLLILTHLAQLALALTPIPLAHLALPFQGRILEYSLSRVRQLTNLTAPRRRPLYCLRDLNHLESLLDL
jgi:hypothetical protein